MMMMMMTMMMMEEMMMMMMTSHHLKMAKLMQRSWKKSINTSRNYIFCICLYIFYPHIECRTSHSADINNYFVSLSFLDHATATFKKYLAEKIISSNKG